MASHGRYQIQPCSAEVAPSLHGEEGSVISPAPALSSCLSCCSAAVWISPLMVQARVLGLRDRCLAQSQPPETPGENHCPGMTRSARLAHLRGNPFSGGTETYSRHIYLELILGLIMQLKQAPGLVQKGLVRGCVLLGLQPPSGSFPLQPQHSRAHGAGHCHCPVQWHQCSPRWD